VAFLFLPFPPLFLLGPLAGLLLLGRPRTAREWAWILASVGLAAMASVVGAGTVAQEVVLAAAACFTGTFLAILLVRTGRVFPRACAAAAVTAGTVVAGCLGLGLGWGEIRSAIEGQMRDAMTLVLGQSGLSGVDVATLSDTMTLMARIYPGLAVLGAIGGGCLAATIAARVATKPVVALAETMSDFRFNDQLIWGAIGSLALVLLPLGAPWADLAANVATVVAGLYLARGWAIALTAARRWPLGLSIALFLGALLLLPYALSGLVILGLADTWIDIRRALNPPPSGGVVS
jgi:hypothetical protein